MSQADAEAKPAPPTDRPTAPETVLEVRSLVCQRGRGDRRFRLEVEQLDLHAGEILVILGPNGAGKSTLLRALAGLEPSAPKQSVRGRRGPTTLVFQRPAAFSGSVRQNVAAALLGKGVPEAEGRARIQNALARFEIEGLAEQNARTLSGGELRRLALARALVLRPEVLLLDEPFDDLDSGSQQKLSADLERTVADTGVALAVVTHDLRRALLLADRIAVLEGGALVQQGPSETMLTQPATPSIARIVGMTNLADGRVVRDEAGLRWIRAGEGFEIPTEAEVEIGEEVWIGIRPEHLKIDVGRGDGYSIGKARVESLLSDGLAAIVTLRVGERVLRTHLLAGRGTRASPSERRHGVPRGRSKPGARPPSTGGALGLYPGACDHALATHAQPTGSRSVRPQLPGRITRLRSR